jgi:hypothetical protein
MDFPVKQRIEGAVIDACSAMIKYCEKARKHSGKKGYPGRSGSPAAAALSLLSVNTIRLTAGRFAAP